VRRIFDKMRWISQKIHPKGAPPDSPTDPSKRHDADMPGFAELRAPPTKVEVSYTKLSAGVRVALKTRDLTLLTAIHRWFGVQLSEHGADAKASEIEAYFDITLSKSPNNL